MPALAAKVIAQYSVPECVQRLRAVTVPETFWSGAGFSSGTFMTEKNGKIRLRVQRAFSRNSFARMLYIRLTHGLEGTTVTVRARMHPLVKVFMTLWLSGAVGIPIVGIVAAVIHRGSLPLEKLPMVLPAMLFLPLAGIALVTWGIRSSENDVREMFELVKRSLNAIEAP
jgi:hypothetical protein